MKRPTRIASALLIFGLATALLGTAFKLNHLMGAEGLFNVGIGLLVGGLLVWGGQTLGRRKR